MLFYNSATREGAVGMVGGNGQFTTTQSMEAGSFGRWTHIASDGAGRFLFYNSETREGAVGMVGGNGQFTTTQSMEANSFGRWTHIA